MYCRNGMMQAEAIKLDEYRRPYLTLFNITSQALEALRKKNYGEAELLLVRAQQEAEDVFISEVEDENQMPENNEDNTQK